jgi:hypothetical protein
MANKWVQPALVGGLVMGVLTALPIISVGNLCCCLWVIGGGVVAAYLLQRSQPAPIETGDGALVGLFAGVVGAFVYLVVSIPIGMVSGPMLRPMLQRLTEQMTDMPPEFREFATSYTATSAGMVVASFIGFVFWLIVGAIFSTVGGLIGAAIFRKRAPGGSGAPGAPGV